jgi:Fe2+ or Zn2+ uptake regulation protein|tara:strand:- start:1424 stop:1594 length:171 start_codon:yes stop_codon:yes gene_type:complete
MKNKDKILEVISNKHCGITTTQIFEKLSDEMDKTTVYRNIEKLLKECEIIEDFDRN